MPVTSITNPLLILLGILSALVAGATLTGTRLPLPLISNDRSALIALVILGISMCALGMQTTVYGWLNPFNLGGIILGILALGLAIVQLVGIRVPYISSDRAAIAALTLIMVVKIVLAVVRGIRVS